MLYEVITTDEFQLEKETRIIEFLTQLFSLYCDNKHSKSQDTDDIIVTEKVKNKQSIITVFRVYYLIALSVWFTGIYLLLTNADVVLQFSRNNFV